MLYSNKNCMVSSEIAKEIAMAKSYLVKQFGNKWYEIYEVCYNDTDGVYIKEK